MGKWLWLSLAVVILDQATKYMALAYLQFGHPVAVIPFLNFRLAFNPGAAFSFLSDAGGWQRWFFVVLTLGVTVFLLTWLLRLRPPARLLGLALSLIIGGAVGNLVDRLRFGYVVDFIDFYVDNWHWPTFNVADSAITVGVAFMLLDSVLEWRGQKRPGRLAP